MMNTSDQRRFLSSKAWIAIATALVLHFATAVAVADTPRLLFDRAQVAELRHRIARPELAPVWTRVLADAEAYCDPKSGRYADPQDPCPLPKSKSDRMEQKRHDALLVHTIGRILTQRMEAIGFAYQLTGRKELGRHGAAILAATVERYPVSDPIVAKGFAGGRGDIMHGLALGYDMLAECLDEPQRRKVAAACADYVEAAIKEFNNTKLWWYKVHNYNGVNGGAAGCLALALHDAFPDRAPTWTAECRKTVERWLDAGFDRQGAYVEGVAYSGYGLSNSVMFAVALRRAGQGDLFQHPAFGKLADFYALSLLPGERVYDARNDSNYSGLGAHLLGLTAAQRGGLYKWLWDNSGDENSIRRILWDSDIAAVAPVAAGVPLARHFQGRGLCIWRTGWTSGDVMFAIEAGPYYPVTHNQADKGHFTLYGLGYRWATDPGYANEHEREGRGQTLGHNCVLVDGQGQALSGAGLGTNGVIARYENNARYGYALADCTEAYNRNSRGTPGAGVSHARRHAFFVHPRRGAPAYAVVIDDIAKDDRPHEFAWQMMFSDCMAATLGDGRAVFEPPQTSGHAYVDTPADSVVPGKNAEQRAACRLAFDVKQAGHYVLWARVRTPREQPGKSDSFFVEVDAQKPIAWHMPATRDWTWSRVSSGASRAPVTFKLDAGQHNVVFRMREPGAQLDCLLLSTEQEVAPSVFTARGAPLFLEAEAGQLTSPMRIVESRSSEPRMVLRIHADGQPALKTDVFRPTDYHAPADFPRLRATVQAVRPRFMAVLLPLPAAVKEPEVRFETTGDKRTATIRWPDHADTFEWTGSADAPRLLQP